MRYYIHIPLPEELRSAVLAVEKEYQGNGKSDPHITIIPPREIIEGRLERELISAIAIVVKNLHRWLIVEKGVGYFEGREGNKETIYIGIHKTPTLAWLQEALVEGVSGILKAPIGNFTDLKNPHITLATRLSPERAEEAWAVLKDKKFFDFFFSDAVTLLRKNEHDAHWQSVISFKIEAV